MTVVFVAWRSGRLARDALRVWNGLSHRVVYAITAHVVAILKSTLDDRDRLIGELRDAAANIGELEGLLPVCAWCKKLRDDARDGEWVPIDDYITTHTDAMISHGICRRCAESTSARTPEPRHRTSFDEEAARDA